MSGLNFQPSFGALSRTSRMAYCSESLLPSSANWTNRFQSSSCTSIPRYANRKWRCRRRILTRRDQSVHPFNPLSARCGSHEWIRKVLCFPRNLVPFELHDADGVRRLAVIVQDEFGEPIAAARIRRIAKCFLFGWLARWFWMLLRPRVLSPDCGYSSTASSDRCGAPFQNRWHRTPPNADPAPRGSLDPALQNPAGCFADRSSRAFPLR